jgi:transposase
MQDGAPGHSAIETQAALNERGIYSVFWPAFSPDLSSIETVWDRMKDYIERHYPEYHSSHDKCQTVALYPFWSLPYVRQSLF